MCPGLGLEFVGTSDQIRTVFTVVDCPHNRDFVVMDMKGICGYDSKGLLGPIGHLTVLVYCAIYD